MGTWFPGSPGKSRPGGGTNIQNPKSYLPCGGVCQNTEVEVSMPIDQGQLFEKDRFGYNREEYKHHGLEPNGTMGAREGAPPKKFSSLSLPMKSLARNSWGMGS